MQAFWGDYGFPVNGAEVTSAFETEFADWGNRPIRYRATYHVEAIITGSGQADLSNKESQLLAKLRIPDQNFIFKRDDGGESSAVIKATDTESGTRVTNIRFPVAQGGEFANRRTVSFDIIGTYRIRGTEDAVTAWQETITITGSGLPETRWSFPINAPAVLEYLTPNSLVRMTQVGFAVGHKRYPNRPNPLYPPPILLALPDTKVIQSPRYLGRTLSDFPIQWSYSYERGDGPLVGLPQLPPGLRLP